MVILHPPEWNRVNGKLTSVFCSFFFAATRNSRPFFVGGSKPVGSRFQVETRKTKWRPKINISRNALFRMKQRYEFAINPILLGGNFTPPASGIGLRESLPLVFFQFFSQPQEIIELSSWGVVNQLDPGFRSKLEKQNGGQKSIFPKMHFSRRETEVRVRN